MVIVMHMSVLSCGALFLGPRLPRPGKGPQVTRRMFSVIFFYSGTFIALVRPYVACEQALCLGKNSEEREGLFPLPTPLD